MSKELLSSGNSMEKDLRRIKDFLDFLFMSWFAVALKLKYWLRRSVIVSDGDDDVHAQCGQEVMYVGDVDLTDVEVKMGYLLNRVLPLVDF